MYKRLFSIVLASSALLAACSTTRAPNPSLELARDSFKSAQGDPRTSTLAADEMQRADRSLRVAERAWAEGGTNATVDHFAYMTIQRVNIAKEIASKQAAEDAVAATAAEKDQRAISRKDEANIAATKSLIDAGATQTEILFGSGAFHMLPGGSGSMAKLVNMFKNDPHQSAVIEGYTDSMGSVTDNQSLSQQRANAVFDVLVSMGVPAGRLSTHAYGETRPKASNRTAAGRQMNRRVVVVFARQVVAN